MLNDFYFRRAHVLVRNATLTPKTLVVPLTPKALVVRSSGKITIVFIVGNEQT